MRRDRLARLSTCSKLGFARASSRHFALDPRCDSNHSSTTTPTMPHAHCCICAELEFGRPGTLNEPGKSTNPSSVHSLSLIFRCRIPPISHSFLTKCLVYATEIEFRRHAATAGQGVAHVLSWSSVFYRPLKRALNRESQAQQDMKSTEWYALRRHNPRIHTWHTAAPPYCTYSKLEFTLGC